ncbi:MAG: CDP-alcohol phosphatidyltransferase family protein [Herpetosiphonaceae bacterium]|nr:CDP-alcohol phosphatidyltransferase family protein [Herpetosiphonaceae bacterium]
MVDKVLRVPKEKVLAPIATHLAPRIHPTTITLIAFGFGLVASGAVWQRAYGLGVSLWLINRVLDGLDGTVARLNGKQSDLGGYIDVVLDHVIYATLPIALVLAQPSVAAWLSLTALLSSFYINGASWMFLAALLEKRRAGASAQGELTTITMPGGLIEGTETVVFYALFLLFPGATTLLFSLMAVLVFTTIVQRLVWALRHLQ